MNDRLTITAVPAAVDRGALYDALAALGFSFGSGDIVQIKVDEGALDVAVVVRYPDGAPMVNDEGAPAIHRVVVPIVDAPARPAHRVGEDPTPTQPAGMPVGFPVPPTTAGTGSATVVHVHASGPLTDGEMLRGVQRASLRQERRG